jgi:hypothetical protein
MKQKHKFTPNGWLEISINTPKRNIGSFETRKKVGNEKFHR